MVSSNILKDGKEDGLKSEKLLEELKIRDEFLLDPSYPPRQKKCLNKKSLFIAFTIILTISFLSYYFTPKIYRKLFHKEERNQFVKYYDFRRPDIRDIDNGLDFTYRVRVFQKNVILIEELNELNPGVKFDRNQFTNWTNGEMEFMLMSTKTLGINFKQYPQLNESQITSYTVPDSFDWRYSNPRVVTSVKNQGNCGSCWAFATVASIESQYAITKQKLVDLSEQELLDCDSLSMGCRGGYVTSALLFAQSKGLETEVDYPYSGVQHDQCSLHSEKIRVKIDNAWQLKSDEDVIAEWVHRVGPVTFLMPVPKSFLFYKSGIYNPSSNECLSQAIGVHAMAIVGFGTMGVQKYWIVKNSFGGVWGEQGYIRMARGVNICGFKDFVYAPEINFKG